jgi:hypothetical protein
MLKQLTALARDPKFLPGVYNYCDRWCEHCPVTGRCLVFAAERLRAPASSPSRVVSETQELLQEIGDDLERMESTLAANAVTRAAAAPAPGSRADTPEAAPVHPLEFLARHYAQQTAGFLLSLPSPPPSSRPPSPLEVIAWFHVLIVTKTHRALDSHREALTEVPEMLSDALGSAKVALIGIDRSLAAWQQVALEDEDARIAALIEVLQALRTGIEIRFPGARRFVRPGLDDEPGGASSTSLGVNVSGTPAALLPGRPDDET